FDISISLQAIDTDFVLVLAASYLLFFLSRRSWAFIILQWLLIAVLYLGNAAKLSFFGGPIVPDDVYALRSLILILDGWQRFLVVGSLTALAGLLVFNFHLRCRSAWLALGGIVVLTAGMKLSPEPVVAALDKRFGNSVWNQRDNYLKRGATLYSLQETARFFRDAEQVPDREKVLAAAGSLLNNTPPDNHSSAPDLRNVHFILLESFWDPLALKGIRFDRDPLDPRFRELWQATGRSGIMSPVFGGYTANAEFESLCGFPVIHDDVKFERRLVNDAPCLPAILDRYGYDTVVSHPNVASFWNRINAYRRIGFDTYWSIDDFNLDDMNLNFLSDSSLYRQVWDKLNRREHPNQAVFNYIITYFGHWAGPLNYPLNESRPQVIRCKGGCETPEIESYANAMYYKSRELMTFVDDLHTRDPNAIIVAFGDHLPFLGGGFSGYVEAEIMADARDKFTPEMFLTYVTTPLIVIDGQRGPLDMGTIPLYRLPGEIARLLGINEPTILDYSRTMTDRAVRPLWGMHFVVDEQGQVLVCKDAESSPDCTASFEWLDRLLTVGIDIFQGDQHAVLPSGGTSGLEDTTVRAREKKEAQTAKPRKPPARF
ncbi:MAG: sulfatase-like hydrolase/transferase, partial [Desulfobulbaceae bacterium]|nr:sulfatase-like hydrolase/transferase [Desulfobulbaceae bacterium]